MSVEYMILKVDGGPYAQWLGSHTLDEMDDSDSETALAIKANLVEDVTDRLYPPELHSDVAIGVDEIVTAFRKGDRVNREVPSSTLMGRILGKKETSAVIEPVEARELTAFSDFAKVVYWSQTGDTQPNELGIESENLELSLGRSGLESLQKTLQEIDSERLAEYCTRNGVKLNHLNELVDKGLPGLIDRWLEIVQECLAENKALVLEVYG